MYFFYTVLLAWKRKYLKIEKLQQASLKICLAKSAFLQFAKLVKQKEEAIGFLFSTSIYRLA